MMPTHSSFAQRVQKALFNKHVKRGTPFLLFLVAGWFGIREFAQIRYDMKKKQGLPAELEDLIDKKGMVRNDPKSLEEEFEDMVEKTNRDEWFNIRGPRPGEDSKTIQTEIREQHRVGLQSSDS